jgi:dihydrolipoamide dehydrogenase
VEERQGRPGPGRHLHERGLHPSKALLQSSEHFEHAGHSFADHGIQVQGPRVDVAKMLARKNAVVKQNNDGILYLFKKNKITFFHGRASFVKAAEGGYELKVAGRREESITGRHGDPRHRLERAGAARRARSTRRRSSRTTAPCASGAVPKKLGVIGAA